LALNKVLLPLQIALEAKSGAAVGRAFTVTWVDWIAEFCVPTVAELPQPKALTETVAVPEYDEFQVTTPAELIEPAAGGLKDHSYALNPAVPEQGVAALDPVVKVLVPLP
jgi:hypothetical protein